MKKTKFQVMRRSNQEIWPVDADSWDEAIELQARVEANSSGNWKETVILMQDVEVETVADLFKARMGRGLDESGFEDLPVNSPCGRECKTVILTAEVLLHLTDSLAHPPIIDGVERAIGIMYFG